MNVKIGTAAVQFPEKKYINRIFFAVWGLKAGGGGGLGPGTVGKIEIVLLITPQSIQVPAVLSVLRIGSTPPPPPLPLTLSPPHPLGSYCSASFWIQGGGHTRYRGERGGTQGTDTLGLQSKPA
jgi:hypothetical protein